eukprot:scaffold161632_cov19-Tisochrysis_lutea.AAC.1
MDDNQLYVKTFPDLSPQQFQAILVESCTLHALWGTCSTGYTRDILKQCCWVLKTLSRKNDVFEGSEMTADTGKEKSVSQKEKVPKCQRGNSWEWEASWNPLPGASAEGRGQAVLGAY